MSDTPRRKLRANWSIEAYDDMRISFPDGIEDLMVYNMWAEVQRDYDALPRWKQHWYVFLTKTGLWRVLKFLGRYTPSALRLRWYYWRHREELEAEYGKRD